MDAKEKAAALKRAGFIDYDLRKTLSRGQKSYITKLWKKESAIFTHPGNFVSRTVSPEAAKKMKGQGYPVAGRRVWVTKEGYSEVEIKTTKKKRGKTDVLITRKLGRKIQRTKVYSEEELLNALETVDFKTLKKNQTVTVRIGSAAPWSAYRSVGELMKYIRDEFKPKDPGTDKAYLITQMAIVEYQGERPKNKGKRNKAGKAKRGKSK